MNTRALWSFDAGNISSEDLDNVFIHTNKVLDEYLDASQHNRWLFLLGTKGCGKTLLLRKKAYNFWARRKGGNSSEKFSSAANDNMFEKLNFTIPSMSSFAISQLSKTKTWVDLWQFSLCLFILKKENIELPIDLNFINRKFDNANRLNDIINRILKDPKEFLESKYFRSTGDLLSLVNNITHSFVYFVDQLDQALNPILLNEEYGLDDEGRSISYLIWQRAQYGFLEASYNLINGNSHIKIFATAREEALDVRSALSINIESYSIHLDYDREDLKTIFYHNMTYTPKELLLGEKGDSLWYRFFGLEELEHLSAYEKGGIKRKEHIFDFLYRHTFQRPREIKILGQNLYQRVVSRRTADSMKDQSMYIQNLRGVVNEAANRYILGSYKNEFVPRFNESYYAEVGRSFTSNVMPTEEVCQIEDAPLNYLYRSGLLGYVQGGYQHFESVSHYIYDETKLLPKSDFYLLHPTLDREMQKKFNFADFLDRSNIVGHGNKFRARSIFQDRIPVGKDISFYKPKNTSRNSGAVSFKISGEIDTYLKLIFVKPDRGIDTEARYERIQNAAKMMNQIANLHFLEILEKRFGEVFKNWRGEIELQLFAFRSNVSYNARIEDYSPKCLDLFNDRLFGRILTAASLLHTDFDYNRICRIIRNFSDRSSIKREQPDERSLLRFLRTGFFLYGLKKSAPYDQDDRKNLRRGLSDFEKDFIDRWWSEYVHHVLMVDTHLDKDHIKYLKGIVAF
ncbi:MAG: hypothetical protein AAF741_16995 [Bacteroidota bacterium]